MQLLRVHQIPGKIVEIIDRSSEYCWLISPYFKPWNLLERTLRKAASEQKKLTFVFRHKEIAENDVQLLNRELGFEIFFVERLHSKIYLNEKEALIASMNLHESSKDNNYEAAVLFDTREEAGRVFRELVQGDILALPPALTLSKPEKTSEKKSQGETPETKQKFFPRKGFCIRCRDTILWSLEKSLCDECFSWWFRYSDYDYIEKYCHLCGNRSETSMRHPLCYRCFQEYKDLIYSVM